MSIVVGRVSRGRAISSIAQFVPETREDVALDDHAIRLVRMRSDPRMMNVDLPNQCVIEPR
jgi:hypothetical protein